MADEETLRESSCLGNFNAVKRLVQLGVKINSQNTVNGRTALHWACKRDHFQIVQYLLDHGADPLIRANDGSLPSDLASNEDILSLLPTPPSSHGATPNTVSDPTSSFTPNYLKHPVFPYCDTVENDVVSEGVAGIDLQGRMQSQPPSAVPLHNNTQQNSLKVCIKARIAESDEKDFVEVELEELSYTSLLDSTCTELEISQDKVAKIRKLPNILVRKDKDVHRLTSNDYLELVLKTEINVQ